MRLASQDIRLEHVPPVVFVNQAGKGGKPHWTPLTQRGIEAFKLFIEKNAFGKFSQSSGQCSTTDRSRQRRMNHSVTAGRRPSGQLNDLGGHFFTGK